MDWNWNNFIHNVVGKYVQTPQYDYVKIALHCESWGDKTDGFTCPKCENI